MVELKGFIVDVEINMLTFDVKMVLRKIFTAFLSIGFVENVHQSIWKRLKGELRLKKKTQFQAHLDET